MIEFDQADVVRHPLVSKIIRAYQKKALMIKINVILNNIIWRKYLANPSKFIDKVNLNIKNKLHKRKN